MQKLIDWVGDVADTISITEGKTEGRCSLMHSIPKTISWIERKRRHAWAA